MSGTRGFVRMYKTSAFILDEDLSETWVGISWGYGIREGLGIGVTQYVPFRYHKSGFQTTLQNLKPDGSLKPASDLRYYDNANWRLLWKAGATFDYERGSLGMTFTTPSIRFYHEGELGVNKAIAGVDLDEGGTDNTLMAVDYASEVESDYRTPFSLGLAATYPFGSSRLHLSAEWFDAVDKCTVMDAGDFVAQSSGDTLSNRLTHELDSVLNFGVGIEHSLKETFEVYGGFATDYSARKEGTDTNLSITDWHIYSVTGGAAFSYKRFQYTVGLGYAWGRKGRARRPSEIVDLEQERPGLVSYGEFDYNSLKGIIGVGL